MEQLIEIFSDDDTVVKGLVALARVKINGHKFLGRDATVSVSVSQTALSLDDNDLLWCYLEKERGKPPVLYPVISKTEED